MSYSSSPESSNTKRGSDGKERRSTNSTNEVAPCPGAGWFYNKESLSEAEKLEAANQRNRSVPRPYYRGDELSAKPRNKMQAGDLRRPKLQKKGEKVDEPEHQGVPKTDRREGQLAEEGRQRNRRPRTIKKSPKKKPSMQNSQGSKAKATGAGRNPRKAKR